MDTNYVTTPFGRRPMTLAMLAEQKRAHKAEPNRSLDKWKIYRALCEARTALGITDRSLALLNALLSFYPKTEISRENGLVVFPSNQQLSLRANGMAEPTIRRHIGLLIAAGLITRKDSANGKRYVRRNRHGEIGEAFGFSLAPLLARADEIESLARRAIADRMMLQEMKEALTICRRDVAKLILVAVAEKVPGDWAAIQNRFRDMIDAVPRKADRDQLAETLSDVRALRSEITKLLETHAESSELSACGSQNERHIQKSESESHLESDQRTEQKFDQGSQTRPLVSHEPKVTLDLVLSTCPQIGDYGPGGTIRSWRDLRIAAEVVSSMLGISPSAAMSAREIIGVEETAIVIGCILERCSTIASAGGYLRRLTREAEEGRFSLLSMLAALKNRTTPTLVIRS
jgi:replication initiation protein RepC